MAGYILDFYCHRASVCIELDGASHELFHAQEDRERDRILEEMGILTLRFRNEEVAEDWSKCPRSILFACIERDSENLTGSE
jgi:very-short-patch-repair endonuclease